MVSETVQGKYQSKNLRIMMYNLENAVKEGIRGCRHAVSQEGRIPSLEEHTKSTPEVSSSLSLWLPSIPGQCSSKLLHLSFNCLVPAPQGLGGKREEAAAGNPLLLRSFFAHRRRRERDRQFQQLQPP